MAPITATLLVCAHKFGLIEFYQVRIRRRYFFDWEVCEFCICFWLSLLQVAILVLIFPAKIFYIVVPFAAASLAKAIYENCKNFRR